MPRHKSDNVFIQKRFPEVDERLLSGLLLALKNKLKNILRDAISKIFPEERKFYKLSHF